MFAHKGVLLVVAVVCICIWTTGCENQESGSSSRVREVSAENRRFQDVLETMEEIKAELKKHDDLYELATQKEHDVLDNREARIAAQSALREAVKLEDLAVRSLDDDTVIRNVAE